jgi:DNA-binding XRE family transcriptional regulator
VLAVERLYEILSSVSLFDDHLLRRMIMDDINPQFIKTPSGEELVVFTRAEFEALRRAAEGDDDDDVAIFDARMRELNAGLDSRLPPQVSAFMLKGTSLLKAVRKWRRLTQAQLAAKSDVAQGYISDIEGGKKKGTLEVLATLAKALSVDERWLLP